MIMRGYGDGLLSPMRWIVSIGVRVPCCGRSCLLPWSRKTERVVVVVVAVAVVVGPLLGIEAIGHMRNLHLLVLCYVKVSKRL